MFWLRNMKNNFLLHNLIWGPSIIYHKKVPTFSPKVYIVMPFAVRDILDLFSCLSSMIMLAISGDVSRFWQLVSFCQVQSVLQILVNREPSEFIQS